MGPLGSTETSVGNYHYLLPNNPEERSSHLLRGGILKSHIRYSYIVYLHKTIAQVQQNMTVVKCLVRQYFKTNKTIKQSYDILLT